MGCIGEIAVAAELHDNAETATDRGVSKRGEVANDVVVAQFLENVNLLERVGLRILNMEQQSDGRFKKILFPSMG